MSTCFVSTALLTKELHSVELFADGMLVALLGNLFCMNLGIQSGRG